MRLGLSLLVIFLGLASSGCADLDPQFGALRTEEGAEYGEYGEYGEEEVEFGRDIRPIFDRADTDPAGPGCRGCHYSTEAYHVGLNLGGLDLATLGALRKGGATSGPDIVIPGDPESSVLMQKLRGTYPFGARMPRSGPPYLSDEEIELVRYWIEEGARGEDDE